MPAPTLTFEAEFTPATWTDISADVLRPISLRRGMDGAGPLDLVASTGQLSIRLINSALNSAGLLGYYSPDHANARSGFDIGLRVRLTLDDGVNPPQIKFYGKLVEITPSFGQKGERITEVSAVDIMDEMAIQKLSLLSVQLDKRNDQITQTLVGALPAAPLATEYSVGPATFAYALHNDRDESTTVLSALQKAMQSGLDYLFPRGDTTGGETLVYQSRHARILSTSLAATFNDTMRGMELVRSADEITNRLVVVSHPVQIDAAADTVLFALQRELSVQPGETLTITARFRDPSGADTRISGVDIVDPLVADTDFKMSSVSGDDSNDLNASASISLTVGANAAEVAIENTGGIAGYVNKLQLRGKGIYLYDPVEYTVEDAASVAAYGERPLTFELPNNDNPNTGKDFGDHLLNTWKAPGSRIEALRIVGNSSQALLEAAVTLEPGDRIAVSETATGVDGEFFVQGYDMQINAKDMIEVDYLLKEAFSGAFWLLGVSGYSELDDATVLGF
ncbi:MAG: hypothetical protein O3B43_06495 [Chloroflexi bacterium]|nr:hypothetical protein [Chloroflexota bacterium]